MASNILNFGIDKVLPDRTGVRLGEAATQFAVRIMNTEGVSVFGQWVGLEPIQKELKTLDAAIYLNNFFKDIEAPVRSFCSLAYDVYDLTTYSVGLNPAAVTTVRKMGSDFANFLYGLNKMIGDGAAACKFLGRFVPVLGPHKETFGVVKNVCSVTRAVWDIHTAAHKLRDNWNNPAADAAGVARQNAEWYENWAQISGSIFSGLLNGFGALDTIFGSNMQPEQRMPTVAWIFWSAMGTLSVVAAKRANDYKPRA